MMFVVDTLKQCSVALICGGREEHLARKAFPGAPFRKAFKGVRSPSEFFSADSTLCDLGPLCSRKLEYLPKCSEALQEGVPDWFCQPNSCKAFVTAHERSGQPIHDSVKMK